MGAPSKRAKKIRQASEFDIRRLALELMPPRTSPSVFAWSLDDIRNARDAQMRGQFRQPARMAEGMRTDDAIFVARENRLAPQRSIEVAIVRGSKAARAEKPAAEADALYGPKGIGIRGDTIADIHGCLVDHGISFGVCTTTVRPDGSRSDVFLKAWPIEWVRWDASDRTFKTQTEAGFEETIVHGDGRWVVFSKNEIYPFRTGAIIPAALVWARHAFGARDWAKGSVAHGNAKVVGEMPMGVPLQKADGELSEEAAAFLELLKGIGASDAPVGIRPAGSKTDYLVNQSTAWQIFQELVNNADKAAARIFTGTDGFLGAQGGAPGVDITALLGCAATIVEGDLECLERGFKEGVIDPWCAMNFGSSELAPTRRYLLPDPDEQTRRMAYAARRAAMFEDLKAARDSGCDVDQAYADEVAAAYGVKPPKIRPKPAPETQTTTPAPTAPALRSVAR